MPNTTNSQTETPRCSVCGGTPHTLGECPACGTREDMEASIKRMNGELQKLRGIIARNALQRLRGEDATELYVTADDIKDSLEVLYAWQARKAREIGQPD